MRKRIRRGVGQEKRDRRGGREVGMHQCKKILHTRSQNTAAQRGADGSVPYSCGYRLQCLLSPLASGPVSGAFSAVTALRADYWNEDGSRYPSSLGIEVQVVT